MIRWLGPTFMRAGIKGVDMSKTHRREIPECMGAVCAIVYLLVIMVFIPFPFYKDIVAATSAAATATSCCTSSTSSRAASCTASPTARCVSCPFSFPPLCPPL